MKPINSVAVLGAGTMGLGIAAVCANLGRKVLLLDMTKALADSAVEKMLAGRNPMITDPEMAKHITTGSLDDDLAKIADSDWICEAVVERIDIKQALFNRIAPFLNDDSVISTNTSGIPLKEISAGLPKNITERITITHFFNPVHIMKLVELIPGEDTNPEVFQRLDSFLSKDLQKGVVYAKDTVNFIGNRIGCFWILSGLHIGENAVNSGMPIETIDGLMQVAGLPSTGLYGLVDLIGLDIMYHVGKNLDKNLPSDDIGHQYNAFPTQVAKMFDQKQLGRKTGGGFYKMNKHEDGSKSFETFDTKDYQWRDKVASTVTETSFKDLYYSDSEQGALMREVVGTTLLYAADLVPEISDDIVNIDNAMKWGFAWKYGPFEMLDLLEPKLLIAQLQKENKAVPKMLTVLANSTSDSFYSKDGNQFLGLDGNMQSI